MAAVGHAALEVIHQIAFHAVDDFEEFLRVDRGKPRLFPLFIFSGQEIFPDMVGVRKRLYIAVIGDGDGRHAPGVGPFYQVLAFRYAVHIAHLGVQVQLDPLLFGRILPLLHKRRDGHDAGHRSDGQFMLEGVLLGHAFDLDKGSLFKGALNLLDELIGDKDLAVNTVRKIGQAEFDDISLAPDLPEIHIQDLAAQDHFLVLADQVRDLDGSLIDFPSINEVRVVRKFDPFAPLLIPAVPAIAAVCRIFALPFAEVQPSSAGSLRRGVRALCASIRRFGGPARCCRGISGCCPFFRCRSIRRRHSIPGRIAISGCHSIPSRITIRGCRRRSILPGHGLRCRGRFLSGHTAAGPGRGACSRSRAGSGDSACRSGGAGNRYVKKPGPGPGCSSVLFLLSFFQQDMDPGRHTAAVPEDPVQSLLQFFIHLLAQTGILHSDPDLLVLRIGNLRIPQEFAHDRRKAGDLTDQ